MSWNSKKYNRKDHEDSIRAIFNDLVKNRRSSDDSDLFVRVEQIISDSNSEDCQSEYIVELSVLTPMIYEYDKETILHYKTEHSTESTRPTEKSESGEYKKDTNKKISIENYRPFFVSVTVRISEADLDKFKIPENPWLKAEFHEEPINGYYPANLILVHSSFARPIIAKRNIRISNGSCIYNGKDINALTKEEYDINDFNKYIVAKNDVVTTELSNAWTNKGYKYIDIYNVGHGNADYIVCNDKKKILYDIGAPYRVYSLKSFPKAEQAFRQLKPNLVIISHWDADHYMGCGYASDDIFTVKWIAPQLIKGQDNSINLFRLVAYLTVNKKLMLIDRNSAGKLVALSGTNGNSIKLLMGSCTAPETTNITQKNREGLYIELGEKNDKNSVLAGDVTYNSMDSSIFSNQLTFLHVPHHCSRMDTSELQNSVWGEEAVISTNHDASSGKPKVDKSHQQELISKFNNIHCTSEQQGSLLSIRLHKSGLVEKLS